MKWGDIKLVKDPEGVEMLVWNTERGTKTRTGEKAQVGQRKFPPMAVETGTDRYPVKLYKAFASRRPDSMKLADSPFFLQVKTKGWEESQVWYYPTPWGKNKIGEILTKARSVIGLETSTGKVSNHSVRKTGISRLLDNDVPPTFVTQLSGHKNIESLNSYHCASKEHQKQMSRILSSGDEPSRKKLAASSVTRPAEECTPSKAPLMETSSSAVKINPSSSQPKLMVPDFGQPTTKPHDLFQSMFAGANISNCVFHFSPNPYSAQRHIPNVALFPTGEENPVCRPRKKVRIVESDSDED